MTWHHKNALNFQVYSVKSNHRDTQGEKAPSNKSPALTKSMNMVIWVVGTSNQFFLRGS